MYVERRLGAALYGGQGSGEDGGICGPRDRDDAALGVADVGISQIQLGAG